MNTTASHSLQKMKNMKCSNSKLFAIHITLYFSESERLASMRVFLFYDMGAQLSIFEVEEGKTVNIWNIFNCQKAEMYSNIIK